MGGARRVRGPCRRRIGSDPAQRRDAAGSAEFELGELRLRPGTIERLPSPGGDHVAICIATHEPPPELLRAQIDSIRAQTHEDWSCVISDDASSPAALREIEALVDGDERFAVLPGERRLGFYRNFERALKAVPPGAAFVALADQDDRWDPDKLAALVDGIGDADLVHSDARVVDEAGEPIASELWPGDAPGESLAEVLFANPVTGASCLFRRELLEFALPFPALAGAAFHDRWLALVAAAHGSIARVDRPLYDYVQHGDAAFGHEGVAGIPPDPSRLAAARRRIRELAAGELRPDWRSAHDDYLLRSLCEATTLRLRLGDRLGPGEREAIAEVEGLAGSARSRLKLGARAARRAPRRAARDRAGARARRRLAGPGARPRLGPRHPQPRHGAAPLGRPRQARARSARFGSGSPSATPTNRPASAISSSPLRSATRSPSSARTSACSTSATSAGAASSVRSTPSSRCWTRFPCDAVPDAVRRVAWVRNWTERWTERSWFERYELALASSDASARLIGRLSAVPAATMPLATDPARFHPVPSEAELACDLLFVGNHWGGERVVADLLPTLAERFRVRVFGRGWEEVEGMAELSEGPIAHDRLAAAYCSAALVVDDSAAHAAPYGAVNSRVFDALACGAAVASNDAEGVKALFGERFPVFSDAESLASLAAQAIESPAAVGKRTSELRRQVLERHTYAQRARQLLAALAPHPAQR